MLRDAHFRQPQKQVKQVLFTLRIYHTLLIVGGIDSLLLCVWLITDRDCSISSGLQSRLHHLTSYHTYTDTLTVCMQKCHTN